MSEVWQMKTIEDKLEYEINHLPDFKLVKLLLAWTWRFYFSII